MKKMNTKYFRNSYRFMKLLRKKGFDAKEIYIADINYNYIRDSERVIIHYDDITEVNIPKLRKIAKKKYYNLAIFKDKILMEFDSFLFEEAYYMNALSCEVIKNPENAYIKVDVQAPHYMFSFQDHYDDNFGLTNLVVVHLIAEGYLVFKGFNPQIEYGYETTIAIYQLNENIKGDLLNKK